MTRNEIADAIYEHSDDLASKASAKRVVAAVFQEMFHELGRKGEVSIGGFGKFTTKYRKEREGRNPINGEQITIKARYVPHFKPASVLKDAVNS